MTMTVIIVVMVMVMVMSVGAAARGIIQVNIFIFMDMSWDNRLRLRRGSLAGTARGEAVAGDDAATDALGGLEIGAEALKGEPEMAAAGDRSMLPVVSMLMNMFVYSR